MHRYLFLLALLPLCAFAHEPISNECENANHHLGYEVNGRHYFYWNYCYPGWDLHHGIEPSWSTQNRPYYYDYFSR